MGLCGVAGGVCASCRQHVCARSVCARCEVSFGVDSDGGGKPIANGAKMNCDSLLQLAVLSELSPPDTVGLIAMLDLVYCASNVHIRSIFQSHQYR